MDQEKKIIEQVIEQEDAHESLKPLPPIEIDIAMPKQLFGGCSTPQKMEWPELVGLSAEEAEIKIKEDMPMASVKIVPPDSFVTMDFNTQRVRIFVDSSNIVVRPPRIG